MSEVEHEQNGLQKDVSLLLKLLEKSDFNTLSPIKIEQINPTIYRRLIDCLPKLDSGLRDWTRVVENLPLEWQKKWKLEKPREIQLTDISKLEEKLEELNPQTFSPLWILENLGGAYYQRILRRLGQTNGRPDWEKLVTSLKPIWQSKWHNRKKNQSEKSQAELIREVEFIIRRHKDQLHVFIHATTTEDEKTREKIIRSLLNLIRKGNPEAKTKLWELLQPLIHDLLNSRPKLAVYKEKPNLIRDIFEKTVISYKNSNNLFINYFFIALSVSAASASK